MFKIKRELAEKLELWLAMENNQNMINKKQTKHRFKLVRNIEIQKKGMLTLNIGA
jgi:hypothetical protein